MQRRPRFSQEQGARRTARLCSTVLGISSETCIKMGLRLTPVQTRGRELGAANLCVGCARLFGGSTTRQSDFVRGWLFRTGRTMCVTAG